MARRSHWGTVESHDYYPYGEERASTVGNRNKFGTYHRNQTGLDYADQRYYDSAIGRFLTSDPYEGSGQPYMPTTWGRAGYVEGDPVNANDPTGLVTSTQPFGGAGFFQTCITLGTDEAARCYVWSLTMAPAGQSGRIGITNYDWNELIREMNTQIATGAKQCRDAAGEYLESQRSDGRFGIMSDFQKANDVLSMGVFSMLTAGVLSGVEVATVSGAYLAEATSAFDLARRLFVASSRATLTSALLATIGVVGAYLVEIEALKSQFSRDFPERSLRESMQWYEGIMPRYGKMMKECEDRAAQQLVWRMQYLNNTYYQIP